MTSVVKKFSWGKNTKVQVHENQFKQFWLVRNQTKRIDGDFPRNVVSGIIGKTPENRQRICYKKSTFSKFVLQM